MFKFLLGVQMTLTAVMIVALADVIKNDSFYIARVLKRKDK